MRMHQRPMRPSRGLQVAGVVIALWTGTAIWQLPGAAGQESPRYAVDPAWPKPLPAVKDGDGVIHQWVTGGVGASCVDSRDHVFVVNRGFQRGGVTASDGDQPIPSPPVLEFDATGNLVNSWGDARLDPSGANAVLPQGIHGCFVDYEDNLWIGGSSDGIVQKWTRDGKQMLLQIGAKGACDGPEQAPPPPPGKTWFGRPNRYYPACAEPGLNESRTRLNGVADIYVDPTPDPATGRRGSVYLADGYGNNRVVVFDADGKYLRQWGTPGTEPGQFSLYGGGHPHCVNMTKDGLVYACEREHARINVSDRLGNFKRAIAVDPPDFMSATWRVADIDFSHDAGQTQMFIVDIGSAKIRIYDRQSGQEIGSFGQPGALAGQFRTAHTLATDSKDNVYVAETGEGKRIQKFTRGN